MIKHKTIAALTAVVLAGCLSACNINVNVPNGFFDDNGFSDGKGSDPDEWSDWDELEDWYEEEMMGPSFEEYDSFLSALPEGSYFAWADIGKDKQNQSPALLVAHPDCVFDFGDGIMVTTEADIYSPDAEGNVKKYGEAISGGTAIPLSVGDNCLYFGNHSTLSRVYIDEEKDELVTESDRPFDELDDTEEIWFYEISDEGFSANAPDGVTPREWLSLEPGDSPEWVTKLAGEDTEQLFVVAAIGDTTAWVSMHEKDEDGNWKMIMTSPGFVGKNGICPDEEHVEGCGQTPIGTYHFTKAFGIADDPGCAMPYTKVTDDIYWSGDQKEGMQYNEMVSIKDYPDLDTENSEHIIDYTYPYQYCLNISFNEEGTPGRGSAIFLHCFGDRKPYTGGCVSVPMDQMRYIMKHVSPDCVVVIDTLENLGGEF